jgi:hypothetical protein
MDEIVVNELEDEQDESPVVEIAARPGTTEEAPVHEPIRVDLGRTHKNSGLGTR